MFSAISNCLWWPIPNIRLIFYETASHSNILKISLYSFIFLNQRNRTLFIGAVFLRLRISETSSREHSMQVVGKTSAYALSHINSNDINHVSVTTLIRYGQCLFFRRSQLTLSYIIKIKKDIFPEHEIIINISEYISPRYSCLRE